MPIATQNGERGLRVERKRYTPVQGVVTDYTPDAICFPVAAIVYSPRTTRSVE
jgi:hypothetical protein